MTLAFIPVVTALAVFGSTPDSAVSPSASNATLDAILRKARRVASEHVQPYIAHEAFAAGKQSVIDQLDDMCADKIDSILDNQSVSEDLFRFTPGDWFKMLLIGVALFVVGRRITNSSWRNYLRIGTIVTPGDLKTMTPEQIQHIKTVEPVGGRSSSSVPPSTSARTDVVLRTPDQEEAAIEIRVQERTSCQSNFNKFLLAFGVIASGVLLAAVYRLAMIKREPQTNGQYWIQCIDNVMLGYFIRDFTSNQIVNHLLDATLNRFLYFVIAATSVSAMSALQLAVSSGLFPRCLRRMLTRRIVEARANASASAESTNVRQVENHRRREVQPSAPQRDSDED